MLTKLKHKIRPQMIRINKWESMYDKPIPKIAALLSSAVGGSHFILHKLQGHPQILSLKERALTPELKNYFNFQNYLMNDLAKDQLLPSKPSLENIDWIVLNKPDIEYVVYHFPFQRKNIRLIQLMRNPMGLYYSWLRGFNKMAKRDYEKEQVDPNAFQHWLDAHIMSELSSFAFNHNPSLDITINLESLTVHPDITLQSIYNCLGVDTVTNSLLEKLTHCETCKKRLGTKTATIKSGEQEVLYCEHCTKTYIGAGGYNYIRAIDSKKLIGWKTKPNAEKTFEHFQQLLGKPFMDYFSDEKYLRADGAETYNDLFYLLIDQIRHGLDNK